MFNNPCGEWAEKHLRKATESERGYISSYVRKATEQVGSTRQTLIDTAVKVHDLFPLALTNPIAGATTTRDVSHEGSQAIQVLYAHVAPLVRAEQELRALSFLLDSREYIQGPVEYRINGLTVLGFSWLPGNMGWMLINGEWSPGYLVEVSRTFWVWASIQGLVDHGDVRRQYYRLDTGDQVRLDSMSSAYPLDGRETYAPYHEDLAAAREAVAASHRPFSVNPTP